MQLEVVDAAPQHFCFCEHCHPWAQGAGLGGRPRGPSRQPVEEQQSPECYPSVSNVNKVMNRLRHVHARWQLK